MVVLAMSGSIREVMAVYVNVMAVYVNVMAAYVNVILQ